MNGKHRTILTTALVTVAALVILLATIGASTTTRECIDEQGITNGFGDCFHLKGKYVVAIDGTFDNATATLQKAHRETGGCDSITKLKNVRAVELVGAAAETPYVEITAGEGYYRLLVAGGQGAESIGINICKAGG